MSSPRMQLKSENDDRLNRVKNFGAKGKSPPVIQPKPNRRLEVKPTSTTASSSSTPSIVVTQQNGRKNSDSDMEDPGHIALNPESLAQFGALDAAALDAVKRYHILDSAAQRQKAHLSHGKGLQNRRLPSQFAGKVGDDYQDKRKDFDPLMASNLTVIPEDGGRAHGSGLEGSTSSPLNDEEKEQQIMQKAGVSHGSAIAGLAALFKKSPVGHRMPRSTSGSVGTPPAVRAKPRKTSTPDSPSLSSVKKSESTPSPRSSFKFKLRRKKGRLSRESSSEDIHGSIDDLHSETSSICSASKFSIKEEDILASPKKEISPQHHPEPSLQPSPSKGPLKVAAASGVGGDSVRSSLVFKEPVDIPSLFEEKTSLFDAGELDSILTKSTTVFKEGTSAESKPESSPSTKPKKASGSPLKMASPTAAVKKTAPKLSKKPKVDLSMYSGYEKTPSQAAKDSPMTSAKKRIALFEDKQAMKPNNSLAKDKKAALNSPIRKNASPPVQQKSVSPPVQQKSVSPPVQQKSFSPPVQKKSASPLEQKKNVSPQEQEKPTLPSDQKKSATPPEQKKSVSPPEQGKHVSPPEQKKIASPLEQKKSVSPPEQRKRVSPPEQKKNAAPPEQKKSVSPTEQKKSTLPLEQKQLPAEEKEGGKTARGFKDEPAKAEKLKETKTERKEERAKIVEKKKEEKLDAAKEENKTTNEKTLTQEVQKPSDDKAKESGDQPNWKVMLEERQKKRRELQSEKKEKETPKPSGSSLFSDTTSAVDDAPSKQSVKDEPKAVKVGSDAASLKASLLDDELFQDEEEPRETELPSREEKAGKKEVTGVPSSDAITDKGKNERHSPLLSKSKVEEVKEPEKVEKTDEEKKAENTALFGDDNEKFVSKVSGSPKMDRKTPKTEAKPVETKKPSLSQTTTSKDKKEVDAVEVAVDPLGVLEVGESVDKEGDEEQEEKVVPSKPADDNLFDNDLFSEPVPDKPEKKEDKKDEEVISAEEPSPAEKITPNRAGKTVETKPHPPKSNDAAPGKPSRLQVSEDKKENKTNLSEKGPPKSPIKASHVETDDKPHWKKMLEEKRKAREQGATTGTPARRTSPLPSSEEKVKEGKPTPKDAKDSQPATGKFKPPPLRSVGQSSGDKKMDKSSAEPSPGREGVGSKETTPLSTPTRLTDPSERKSPGVREMSPRHTSPSEPSIPKWKQELLARKQISGAAPLSPRRTFAEPQDTKEGKVPAWKQELLAKKRKQELSASGVPPRSSTVSVPGREGGRHQQQSREVPSFMKEFQAKKRAT